MLPSPIALVGPPPPLLPGATPLESERELRFPGRLRNTERVVVGLRDDGSASRVEVVQRLLVDRVGDYAFTVPAPVLSVVATPDSQSQPGQRNTGIVWQGFSSGRRLLGARASLEPLAAGRGLPLAVELERRGDTTLVRLRDVARRRFQFMRGSASAPALVGVVERLRSALVRGDRNALAGTLQVQGSPGGTASVLVDAPLRVRGTVTAEGTAPTPIDTVLGGGRPSVRTISVRGRRPKLSLRAELFRPEELLPKPRELAAARDPLRLAQLALARVALSGQYDQYLASPDHVGPNRTVYVMRTAAERRHASAPTAEGDDDEVLPIVLASVLGAAALVGLAVLWAHS